jgi:tetratricopeptide (TPR) repeat protein
MKSFACYPDFFGRMAAKASSLFRHGARPWLQMALLSVGGLILRAEVPAASTEPKPFPVAEVNHSNAVAPSPALTNAAPAGKTGSNTPTIGQFSSTNFDAPGTGIRNVQPGSTDLAKFQIEFEAAQKLHEAKDLKRAEIALIQILESRWPDELKRPVLLELGIVMQEQREYPKAQQLFSEYGRRYEKDPRIPEVLLRQAYLYREMGIPEMALSKFYAVMSTCLNLKLDDTEYYQKLVLRAQSEIAETYYLQGKFEEASDYFSRLLRLETGDLERSNVLYKLVRCEVNLAKYTQAVANATLYLEKYSDYVDAPETRFLLADSLKKLGRNKEAIAQMDLLLRKQSAQSKVDPQQWLYWQERAGNDIANQLYREGDFLSALQVYQALAALNTSAEWQIPVWYQIALVYENLKQGQKAVELYDKILARQKEEGQKEAGEALKAVAEMAAWRKQYLDWESKARLANQELQPPEAKSESPL